MHFSVDVGAYFSDGKSKRDVNVLDPKSLDICSLCPC